MDNMAYNRNLNSTDNTIGTGLGKNQIQKRDIYTQELVDLAMYV